mmetsp:Transcript_39761/g.119534  ORF Transcript_39761/g.119534 Transcript_39761/m.119534 type:complete len:219 (-) Transcript_39761:1570-2226(-)
MMQEHCMDRLANFGHPSEAKRQVRNAATDLHVRALLLDALSGVDEINTIVIVLFHSSANCKHIGIKDDILRRKAHFIHQHVIRTLANSDLLILLSSLTIFIEGHHNHSSSMLLQQSRLLLEQLLANFQGDGVHDRLALAPLQSCHHNLKLRSIQHERHLAYLRLCHSNLHKLLHCCQPIQHTIIHVDINNMGTILHLGLGNIHGTAIVTFHHQLLELD